MSRSRFPSVRLPLLLAIALVGCDSTASESPLDLDALFNDARTRDAVADVGTDSADVSAEDAEQDTADDAAADAEPAGDAEPDTAADALADAAPDAADAVAPDIAEDGSPDVAADTTTDVDIDGAEDTSPTRAGLCALVAPSPRAAPGAGTAPGAPLPFAVGDASNIVLGALDNPGAVQNPVALGAVSTAQDLTTIPFDVYVPAGYDGSEPYGLITFINSGDNGGGPNNSYRALLDSERFIHIAPDGAGNSVNVDVRMGRALMGTLRAMELFNIDETRIYTMGNSGGARSAHMLMYQYPQLYAGTLPRCGANFPREVAQDYETQEPDSHYEFWGDFFFPNVGGQPYISALRGFERRYALMTSFDDFREGDVMNIYHNGMEEDGLHARLIQTTGSHCSTNEAHFYDALGFVQHPLYVLADDTFDDGVLDTSSAAGSGVVTVAGTIREEAGALVLDGGSADAAVLVRDRVSWFDWHGLILRARVNLASASASAAVSLRPYDAAVHTVNPALAPVSPNAAPELLVEVAREGAGGTLRVSVQPESGPRIEVFEARFDDWPAATEPIDLRVDIWDAELQLDAGWHLQTPTVTASGARLLDDRRTIRVRWSELLRASPWTEDTWGDGAVVTLVSRDGVVRVDDLQMRDGVGLRCE